MSAFDSSREEEIDEPELNVDDYLYCKINNGNNCDDYLCKKMYTKVSPQKVQEMIDDPELYLQLSNSVISFLKRSQKTSCENSSVSSGSESDATEYDVNYSSHVRERSNKDSSSRRSKKDSLLYLQLSKDRGKSSSSYKEYEYVVDFQAGRMPQYVVNKSTDTNVILPFDDEFIGQQEKLPSVNNIHIQEPLKYITKIPSMKSVKSNVITSKDFQKQEFDGFNITDKNNILLKAYRNVALNFPKQYRSNSNNNNSDMKSHHEFNNNNSVTNSRKNNDILLTNQQQQQQSKLLYHHANDNRKVHSGNSCIPLTSSSNETLMMTDDSYLESSLPPASSSSPSLQLCTSASNIVYEKNNNYVIQKTTLKTTPTKNVTRGEPLQQKQRALNIVGGSGNNYDSIITLSFENSSNNNNQNSDVSNSCYNSSSNKANITGNSFSDNNNNNSGGNNSEIVIEIGDKNKLALSGSGKECMPLQQQQATMVCLKRGEIPSLLQHQQLLQQQPSLFSRSHVTHIVERRLIPSNSNTNKYETTFIQKRSEQLIPIQPCRILDNRQIKQYSGPKIKSGKRNFSAVEPVLISPTQNISSASATVKGTDVYKGISNEQMSSLQRLLKLGTTATVMSNEEKKIKLETIVKKLWAKELSEPSPASPSN